MEYGPTQLVMLFVFLLLFHGQTQGTLKGEFGSLFENIQSFSTHTPSLSVSYDESNITCLIFFNKCISALSQTYSCSWNVILIGEKLEKVEV